MAEWVYGNITVPAWVIGIEAVAVALKGEFGADFMKRGQESQGTITFDKEAARNGEFEELEIELMQVGIPFDRFASRVDDHSAENRYYRPVTSDGGQEVDVTVQDESAVATFELRTLLQLPPDEAIVKLKVLVDQADPEVTPLSSYTPEMLLAAGRVLETEEYRYEIVYKAPERNTFEYQHQMYFVKVYDKTENEVGYVAMDELSLLKKMIKEPEKEGALA